MRSLTTATAAFAAAAACVGCGTSSSAYGCTNQTCKVTFDGEGDQKIDSLGQGAIVDFDGTKDGTATVRFLGKKLQLAEGDSAVAGAYRVSAKKVDGDAVSLRIAPR